MSRGSSAIFLALALVGCARGSVAPDINLRADTGQTWALSQQRGRAVLLTFGFTHCGDTCPATVAKLVHIADGLGNRGKGVEIAFVTVDPQRDTPRVLHAFLRRFESDRLVGLTGSQAQIDAVETAYHVWAQRVPGTRGRGEYDEAHSAVIFLIDGDGRTRGLWDDDERESSLAQAVRGILG